MGKTPSAVFTDMAGSTARLVALEALCDFRKSGEPVTRILTTLFAQNRLSPRDCQLVRALVFGILRRQQYLDCIVDLFSRHPVTKMKPRTLIALRIGVYQLLFMDRIPPSAAVNETVQAFKAGRQPKWLVRFVNGVLRSISRERNSLPTPECMTVDGLSVPNHPAWLVKRWEKSYGRQRTQDICRINNELPPLTLRVNTGLLPRHQFAAMLEGIGRVEYGKFAETALCLPDFHGDVAGLPGYDRGCFVVQDEAAQLATCLLTMKKGGRYLDGCAGVGGKTTHLAALLPTDARLTAIEPEKRRYRLLGENLQRLQVTGVTTMNMDLTGFAGTAGEKYDGILLDVPCSGTGVIRRRPDIRWNRREGDLPGYQRQQLQLLRTAASLVRKDGIIVYATCSLEPEENSEIIDTFLAEYTEFFIEDARRFLPSAAAHLVTAEGYFQPTPEQELDGFFAARLRRKAE